MIFSTFHEVLHELKQQSGAEEACWAHNPEVGGSKPLSATYIILLVQIKFPLSSKIYLQLDTIASLAQ